MATLTLFQIISTLLFVLALIHTFSTSLLNRLSHRYKSGSFGENFFHLFGEVEIVFGFWSGILVLLSIAFINLEFSITYLNSRNFTEPLFVFVVMTVCSTKPILNFMENFLLKVSSWITINKKRSTQDANPTSVYFCLLFFGPLLGSFITEPAAMTIIAFLLKPRFFNKDHSRNFKYATLALLFVNVSIGGTLTPFAAPPILMVSAKWGWDLTFMLEHFAPKTLLAVLINTIFISALFRSEISKTKILTPHKTDKAAPLAITLIHILFLGLMVASSHHAVLFIGLFLFFLGFVKATKEYQSQLNLREPLLVAFFLAGLVVLGGPQGWWLEKLLSSFSPLQMLFGAIGLTSITDNAALTYLGSLVPNLTAETKLALVYGSVLGGGLTIIANAPNPAGFGILKSSFGESEFSASKLFLYASIPTIISTIIFMI